MNKSDSIVAIAKALATAQSEMGTASKDAKNPFFKSNYADLNAIREAVLPVLNKYRISVLQPTIEVEGQPFVETVLLHESGEFISSITAIISAKVNDAQSAGSGISYARRYGLQSFLCVGAEDDDGEKAMGRAKAPYVASTPTKTFVAPANVKAEIEAAEKPKGGFGVKKTETKPAAKGEVTEEGWE
jgi:hypothetical protein